MFNIMHSIKPCMVLYLLLSISFELISGNKQTVVFIDPLQDIYYRDQLFIMNKPLWGNAREKFAKAGIKLTTDKRFLGPSLDCYIVFNAPVSMHAQQMMKHKKVKKILLAWEPPAIEPRNYSPKTWKEFDQVMTFHDDILMRSRFKRLNYCFSLKMPQKINAPIEKKLCTLIASNKKSVCSQDSIYSLRNEVIRFFLEYGRDDFDLWGHGWTASAVYHGTVEDKLACMAQYKFAFCFENSQIPGYITEKIFDAFSAGCVPIYLGAPNIQQYIPKNCYIDYSDFSSLNDLYLFLKCMSAEEHAAYLNAAVDFLQSPQSRCFSYDSFIEKLLETVKDVLRK